MSVGWLCMYASVFESGLSSARLFHLVIRHRFLSNVMLWLELLRPIAISSISLSFTSHTQQCYQFCGRFVFICPSRIHRNRYHIQSRVQAKANPMRCIYYVVDGFDEWQNLQRIFFCCIRIIATHGRG